MNKTKLIIVGILFLMVGSINAQEARAQSGIIYYFTKYVEWPSNKQAGDFVIAVVGNSDIKPHLDALAKAKTVGTRKIVIKKVSSIASAKGSHIIFLPKNKKEEFASGVDLAKSNNALLVTESNGYGKKGAGINFIVKNGKPSFEINKSAISGCGLKVSSKLSSLGVVI